MLESVVAIGVRSGYFCGSERVCSSSIYVLRFTENCSASVQSTWLVLLISSTSICEIAWSEFAKRISDRTRQNHSVYIEVIFRRLRVFLLCGNNATLIYSRRIFNTMRFCSNLFFVLVDMSCKMDKMSY